VQSFADHVESRLKHEKAFICGDKLSIADMVCAQFLFSLVYNNKFQGEAAFSDQGKAIIEGKEVVLQYK